MELHAPVRARAARTTLTQGYKAEAVGCDGGPGAAGRGGGSDELEDCAAGELAKHGARQHSIIVAGVGRWAAQV
jgi:hypothetical protein